MRSPLSTCSRMKMSCKPEPRYLLSPRAGRGSGEGDSQRARLRRVPLTRSLRSIADTRRRRCYNRQQPPKAAYALAASGRGEEASSHLAGIVLRRRDDFQIVARPWHGAERIVDVPLVLHLGGLLGADRIHLHHHLVVVGAEITLARLHDVELRARAQMLGELDRVDRLGLAHRARDDLERIVIAPGLVLRRLAV